ncbi:MAG: hypothetical protein Q4D57_02885 [Clostridia bacterium]|nr:hypothetical protein [Clostridia bacterium]
MSFVDGISAVWTIIKGMATGKGMDILQPTVDKMMKMVTDSNALIDLQTGKTKSGVEAAVDGVLKTIGKKLSEEEVRTAISIFAGKADKVYLGKDLTSNMQKNMEGNKKVLNEIKDTSFMSGYKKNSVSFCEQISKKLKDYDKLFEVFTVDKRFKIFPKRVNYDKIWKARKSMGKCIDEMLKITNEYTKDNVNTYDSIKSIAMSKMFQSEYGFSMSDNGVQQLEEALADLIFEKAIECLKTFEGKQTGGGKHVLLRTYKELRDESMDMDSTRNKITDEVLYAKQMTDGITFDQVGGDATNVKIVPPPPKGQRNHLLGFKQCLHLAKGIVEPLKKLNTDSIMHDNIKISKPLMGDYALELKKCFEYTKKELNNVINLGAKDKDINPNDGEVAVESDDPKKGKIGIDIKRLLGEEYYKANESKWKTRQTTLDDSISKDLLKNMTKSCASAEEEYKKIKKLQKEYFPKEEDRKDNLSKLIVKLPSNSNERDEDGNKPYDIGARYEKLKKLQKDVDHIVTKAKSEDEKAEKDNRVALAYRKAEKFLKACKQWNSDFKLKKRELKKEWEEKFLTIKDRLKRARKLYGELLDKEGITAEQKKAIKKAYKALPMFPYTYARKYKDYNPKMEDFLEWHFDGENLLDKNNNKIC